MPVTLRTKAAAWLRDHRDELVDLVCLWAAPLLAERLFVWPDLPWRAVLCALLIADAVPVCSGLAGRTAGRTFLKCLPSYALVAAATGALWHFAFHLPIAFLGFVPVWLALTWVNRVGAPTLGPPLKAWNSRHPSVRIETVPLETAVLGAAFYLAASYVPGIWPSRYLPITACLAWPAVRALSFWLRPPGTPALEWLRLGLGFAAFSAALACAVAVFGGRFARPDAVLFTWCAIGLAGCRVAGSAAVSRLPDAGAEIARWILLGLTGLWLMQGYASSTLYGAGDALWYAMMLADMLTQVHAGVFPVWVGQSVTQFNGAIYPLRIAPGFHYFGALIDGLTLRALGVIALQNLMVTVVGVGTVLAAYAGLARLVPGRRWLAAGLATLFFACPGVLGMAYKNDLIMSWMTLPWVALAWYAIIRSFRDGASRAPMLLLGASLGLCWWGHSPIALWMTLIASAGQIARFAVTRPGRSSWAGALAGAGLFLAVAAYPIGSVFFYPPEHGLRVEDFQGATPGNITNFVRQVFPAAFLPISPGGHELGDLQLGYSLWAILAFCLWKFRRARLPSAGFALAAALFLALLLIPIPGLNLAMWSAIPEFVRNPTSNWAMNRLYLPLAGAIVFGSAALVSGGILESRAPRRVFAVLLAAGCGWSLAEASKFHPLRGDLPAPPESAVDKLRPENVQLTRFAYFIFPGPPDVFTHGVTDPSMENRLRSADTLALTATNYGAARASGTTVASGRFGTVPVVPGYYVQLDKTLRIEPGRRYLLDFDFSQGSDTHGVIDMFGRTFHRGYALPEYGGSRAFGAGGEHNPLVAVSTSSAEPVDLTLRFFPDKPQPGANPAIPTIGVRLLAYDPAALPVQLDSLIPYRARVRSPSAGWLETPRMHQLGYVATVNGRGASVRRSPDGLAWIAVPAGDSQVELAFHAPVGLQALFWFSLGSIALAAAAGVRAVVRLA
ncbi:MAG TPA: hypothetical protein VN775_13505 [Opitutaceae bacterium]|nr:hypothetical protein [Opitutaceae bacterium]